MPLITAALLVLTPRLILSLFSTAAGTISFNIGSFWRYTLYLITLIWGASSSAVTTLSSPSPAGLLQVPLRFSPLKRNCNEFRSPSGFYTLLCATLMTEVLVKHQLNHFHTFRCLPLGLVELPGGVWSQMWSLLDDNQEVDPSSWSMTKQRGCKINKRPDRSGCRDIDHKPYNS